MNQRKICQIASIPQREESLKLTIDSLINQVDGIFVMLNGYIDVPIFLRGNRKISTVLLDNTMTDGAKCYNIEERDGYVFLCDDDIIYPNSYCADHISGIEKYKCIVTLHGKYYDPTKFNNFYKITRNFRCLGNCLKDEVLNVGGTGVMAWHTDHFKLSYSDIKSANMTDIWVSKKAYEQGVKIMGLAHTENYLKHTRFDDNLFVRENKKGFVEQTSLLREMFNSYIK